ncbi:MAG: SPOR domain-containing protein [Acidiferrobacterales bacterium]
MKWVFAALLLINAGVFMWGSWYRPGFAPAPASRPLVNEGSLQPIAKSEPSVQSSAVTGTRSKPRRADPGSCALLGPFTSLDEVEVAVEKLAALGVVSQQREETQERITRYRVYIPPLRSREAAERKRRQLTKLGVKDHYVIDEPGLENAISLGLFAVKENAWALAHRLAEKGISAKQDTVYESDTAYWLDLRLEQATVARVRQAQWGAPNIGVRQRPCKEMSDAATGVTPKTPDDPG